MQNLPSKLLAPGTQQIVSACKAPKSRFVLDSNLVVEAGWALTNIPPVSEEHFPK